MIDTSISVVNVLLATYIWLLKILSPARYFVSYIYFLIDFLMLRILSQSRSKTELNAVLAFMLLFYCMNIWEIRIGKLETLGHLGHWT